MNVVCLKFYYTDEVVHMPLLDLNMLTLTDASLIVSYFPREMYSACAV